MIVFIINNGTCRDIHPAAGAIVPQRYYKFLNSSHADIFLRGSIKMGGFDTYGLLETTTGYRWIGDREEAIAVTRLDNLSRPGLYIRHSNNVSYGYGYCLSLAMGSFSQLRHEMTNSASPYRYDACIEIDSIDQLVRRIGSALERNFPNFRSMDSHAGPVTYSDAGNVHDARAVEDMNHHNCYTKPMRFASQNEFRIVVRMDRADQTHSNLYIDVGVLSDIATRLMMLPEDKCTVNPFRMNEAEAIATTGSTLKLLQQEGGQDGQYREEAIKRLIVAYGCLKFNSPRELRLVEVERSIALFDIETRVPAFERVTSFSMHGEMIVTALSKYFT